MSKEAGKVRVERLMIENPLITYQEIADNLNISTKTVQRYMRELEAEDRSMKSSLKKRKEFSASERDEVFDKAMDTYEISLRAIKRTEEAVKRYHNWFINEFDYDEEKCPCCGRGPLKKMDPHSMQAYFNGETALNKHLETRAKLLGQISDNPILVMQQADEDFAVIMEEIAAVDPNIARRIFMRIAANSTRRQKRLPDINNIIDGAYEVIEGETE